jgi:hypothetical protein
MFVTYGYRHVKFWVRTGASGVSAGANGAAAHAGGGPVSFSSSNGKFGRAEVADVLCVAFLPVGEWMVSGAASGELLQWDVSLKRSTFGCCVKVRWQDLPGGQGGPG